MPIQIPELASFFTIITSFSSWKLIYVIAKWVFIILDIVFLFSLVYVFKKALQFRPPLIAYKKIKDIQNSSKQDVFAPELLTAEWENLEQKAALANENDFPILLIEADKLTDEALKRCGFQGETMLERLQQLALSREMKSLEVFWRAHKVRNQIAHQANFSLPRNEAMQHLSAYKKFLNELNII